VGDAVANGVLALFREGRSNFSVAEVAERAGVHKTTVYRRWPTRAQLVGEGLRVHHNRVCVPDSGSITDDIRELALALAEYFRDPVEITLNLAVADTSDPELGRLVMEHWQPVEDRICDRIRRAVAAGQLAPNTDAMLVYGMLLGPLIAHPLFHGGPMPPQQVRALAAAVVRAFDAP
jgi:AcrR family transcriptional regulator